VVTEDFILPPQALGPGIRALTTTRHGGVSQGPYAALNLGDHVGDDPAAVAENRRRLESASGCTRIQWLRQVHGNRCIRATAAGAAAVPEADAAWTDEADLGLAVLTADCVPVVVAAPHAGIVGIAHAGWRGLVNGVLEALIAALPVDARDLAAWLGPAIGPADYQVDAPLVRAIGSLPEGDRLVREVVRPDPQRARWRLDLFALASALLVRAGVEQVLSDRISTFADPRCYSHRRAMLRGETTGRMATLVWRPALGALV
jgi:hypothetical protein